MSKLLVTVWAQAEYVCAVHSFIQELLLRVALGLLQDRSYILSDAEFKAKIEATIISVTSPTATENDYVRAIVNAACREMEDLCRLLKYASGVAGLEKIAAEYLDASRFAEMLMRRNEVKLNKLVEIVRKKDGAPVKILMDVAKVLNDDAESYDDMALSAKRKATAELKKVVENVTSIVSEAEARLSEKIDEGKDEIVSRVDAVGAKVDKLKFKGKRKSRHSEEQRRVCFTCWTAAQRNTELKYSTNRGVTYESAFEYFKKELAEVGIKKLSKFIAVIHALQTQEYEARKRELDAKREAERKAQKKPNSRARKR